MAREQFVIHARLVIEAVQISGRDQLDQIAIAFVVLAQKHEVVRALRFGAAILVIVRRNVHFTADDRLDAVRGGLVIKVRSRKKIAVVGDGNGRHPATSGFRSQFADFARAVQQRVIRVEMEVNEV